MSKTNQVCICCEARDTCPHYDTRRTECVPVKCTDWEDFSTIQDTTDWQQVRIQAAIAAMSIVADDGYNVRNEQHLIAKYAVQIADALVAELKKGGQDERD